MFRKMQKQINSVVIKRDDLCVHFGSVYRGKRRGAGLLGSCPFLQLVRGELYKLEEEEKSQDDFIRWNYSISSLCCLCFLQSQACVNAPHILSHSNVFLESFPLAKKHRCAAESHVLGSYRSCKSA